MASPVHPDKNLIDLGSSVFQKLTDILGINNTWKKLLNVLPDRYSCSVMDIQNYEQAVYRQSEPAAAFLRDLGNKNMTAGELASYLEILDLELALLLIKDFEPVRITRDLPSYLEVPRGFNTHFTLECRATGFPRPWFHWFKMSKSEDWEQLKNQNSNKLNIKPVSYEHDGVYICRISNKNPHSKGPPSVIFTQEFRLKVVEPPKRSQDSNPKPMALPQITIHPRLPCGGSVKMGSNLTFQCQAKSAQPVAYEWIKNGHSVIDGTSMCSDKVLGELSVLNIYNIQPENDNSRFTIQCRAINDAGDTMSNELKFNLSPSETFQAEDKVALLIGNGKYSKDDDDDDDKGGNDGKNVKYQNLPNVQHDIIDLAQALKEMGFKVLALVNLEKDEIYNAVDEFCSLLDTNVYGVFYYAGHGFQSQRRAYMVPVDDVNENASAHEQVNLQKCICVDDVEERMQKKNPALCCLILDMCRQNIVTSDQIAEVPSPKLVKRNRIYAYATTSSCMDGKAGGNGLFMKHLLKGIKSERPLKDILDKVMRDIEVDGLASNTQVPEIQSTLGKQLTLKDDILHEDINKAEEREAHFKYLKNLSSHFWIVFQDVKIYTEVETLNQLIDNVLDVKLFVNNTSSNEKYTAYAERITTSEDENVDFKQCNDQEQQYTQIFISNLQKIKGEITMDVVLFCYPRRSPPMSVTLGVPSIAHACMWRQRNQLEDPPESGFLSGSSYASH